MIKMLFAYTIGLPVQPEIASGGDLDDLYLREPCGDPDRPCRPPYKLAHELKSPDVLLYDLLASPSPHYDMIELGKEYESLPTTLAPTNHQEETRS